MLSHVEWMIRRVAIYLVPRFKLYHAWYKLGSLLRRVAMGDRLGHAINHCLCPAWLPGCDRDHPGRVGREMTNRDVWEVVACTSRPIGSRCSAPRRLLAGNVKSEVAPPQS